MHGGVRPWDRSIGVAKRGKNARRTFAQHVRTHTRAAILCDFHMFLRVFATIPRAMCGKKHIYIYIYTHMYIQYVDISYAHIPMHGHKDVRISALFRST